MKFLYEARNKEGQLQSGEIQAKNKAAAAETLTKNQLIIISLKTASEAPLLSRQLTFLERVNLKDIAIFARQLAVMIEAKVPLVQALNTLSGQIKKKSFAQNISLIAQDIEGGTQFSDALAKYPKLFSHLFVSIIKSGEAAGRLQESMIYLAEHSEREYDLKSKIKGAMTYPIFVVIAFIGVAIAMLVFVFPKLTAMITESGQKIPAMTQLIISASDGLKSYWWLLLIILVALIFILKTIIKKPKGAYAWDKFKLRVPIFGKLSEKIYLTRFSENLSSLIAGGIPIVKSLEISGQVIGNKVYEKIINSAIKKVRSGQGIGATLGEHKQIPDMVTNMISVGEQSGQLEAVLQSMSRFYSREVEAMVKNLTSLMEPIIMVAMGVMVAILVAAVLLPIYQISTGGMG